MGTFMISYVESYFKFLIPEVHMASHKLTQILSEAFLSPYIKQQQPHSDTSTCFIFLHSNPERFTFYIFA